MHGYAIMAALARRSDGAFGFATGTLYPALYRLERRGLVTGAWDAPTGRKRRLYTLAPEGYVAQAAAETEWRRFGASVDKVLGLSSR